MIPRTSQGKLGLVSPEELNAINKRIDEILKKLKEIDPNFTPENPNDNTSISIIKMNELPDISKADKNAIYAIPSESSKDKNKYDEYVLLDDEWEIVGEAIDSATIDDETILTLF